MGAGLAMEIALGGHIASLGFVAVALYVPYKYVDPQSNYFDFMKPQAIRGYCIVGEQDSLAVEGACALASRLPGMGISCLVEQHANLDHGYPVSFEHSMSKAVEYVCSR